MGIKGKRKRLREKQLREEATRGEDETSSGSCSNDDEDMAMADQSGPFKPPKRIKPLDLFRMEESETLERMKEEHEQRHTSHLRRKKKQRQEEEVPLLQQPLGSPTSPLGDVEEDDPLALTKRILSTEEKEVMQREKIASGANFDSPVLGLDPSLVNALQQANFHRMTAIQERAIPLALAQYDILGQAKTGSGKTLAFCVPVIQQTLPLLHTDPRRCVALVVGPTKELCVQIQSVFCSITRASRQPSLRNSAGYRRNQGATRAPAALVS